MTTLEQVEVIIVLPALYETQPDLVNFMLTGAKASGDPVIVIRPFGGVVETPQELIDVAHEHVDWNAREMADAIRRQARLEDTQRWDSVDFPGYNADGEIK